LPNNRCLLIGWSKPPKMLVLEYAPLGPFGTR
jgi:hypothetical protein